MEKILPFEMFYLEHKYFKEKNCNSATQIEKWIPILFILFYALVFIASFLRLIKII